ncbi:PTS sugar transporter subunit IIB [Clostridium sp. D2Q-14]|uniref:PTS sugar transporter subunit IIB n=1 Tax=Anaeromonas gelatinilytica TaxID=2683194 RepID=UPI00193C82EA|nr:PTS sugar transporter subunit IIB [Anaeromonas gelatinilytica]MBS4535454.1 PTS sugar transporter subunit IIB [Anaeromonas gelatinilytica]
MTNILLICSGGMSTSALVKKMQESADKRDIEVNIWAIGDAESQEESKKADIILLGPQVRYLESKMKQRVDNKKPVAIIDMLVYGTMNGEKALDNALEVYKNFNE